MLGIKGKSLSVIKSGTDKKNIKNAENLLTERRDSYQRLFESSRDPIYMANKFGNFIDVNPAFLDLFGYTKNELKKFNSSKFYVDRHKSIELMTEIKRYEFVKDFEVKLRRSNGTIIDCLISANTRTTKDGIIIGYQGIIHDITKQKKAQDELKQSEERSKILFEYAPDAYYTCDLKGTFIDGNIAAEEMIGYKKEELIGKSFLKLGIISKKQILRAAKLLAQNMLGRPTGPDEFTLTRKDGSKVDAEISTFPVKINGKTVVLSIARDITEQNRAQEALKFSEEKYRNLVENTPVGIFITTPDGRVVDGNRAAMNLLGYDSREKALKINVADLYNVADDRSRFIELLDKGSVMNFQTRFKHRDGNIRWVSLSSIKQISNNGEIQFLNAAIDITDQKNAERDLEQTAFFLEESQALARIGSYVLEISTGKWTSSNTLNEIFGIDDNHKKTLDSWTELIHPDQREDMMSYFLTDVLSEHQSFNREYRIIRQNDKEERWVQGLGKLEFDMDGNPILMKGTIQDVTLRKLAEQKLKKEHEFVLEANKELKKAFAKEEKLRSALTNAEKLASLGEMASKIAHEINNPLTVIKGQAELRAQMVSDPALKDSLLMIKEKADQIKDLTRGYMNLAIPNEAELTKIKLQDVLKTTVRTLLPLGQLNNIKISEEYMIDEPSIFGDPGRLEQVFRNLIINSVDAMAEKSSSEIKISTKLSEDGKSVEVLVKDNGVGIVPEDIEKIFEPYYTKKERSVGTGLGLVIVKETIENVHGGNLKVVSNIGVGTEFHVLIPSMEYSQVNKKLLIVDDDISISELLAQYFTNKGLKVNTAENGRVAMNCIDHFKPDLILSDIEMPYLDGIVLLEEVLKNNSNQQFVMMTGFDDRANNYEAFKKIDVPLVMKPLDLEDELWPLIKEKLRIAK